MHELYTRIRTKLDALYGAERAAAAFDQIVALTGADRQPPPRPFPLSERDAILICYGDHVQRAGSTPLATLGDFLRQTAAGVMSTVHILPFYPYSSDDGFSVIDYEQVDPALGDWADVRALGGDFRLMFDAVFNHISQHSAWFQAYLRGEAPYTDYFTAVDPSVDLSQVRRPRALPLLTRFETALGERHLWTTFSDDQIDLNAANPQVLVDLIRVLLFYVEQGAGLIRLDAIAYLWKEIGTDSIHRPQTHMIVQLMRDVLDLVKPDVILITETNVPHIENISYFGDGTNEAQMVYNFSLPPLVLHTFRTGSAEALSRWAATLTRMSDQTTFFNFTASHDGIGVTPARGILADAEVEALVQLATDHGGHVSYKNNPDGSRSPYELNITYFDAITHPDLTARDPDTAVRRFLCSQAIMLALVGVPGIYFQNLFGQRNWPAGVEQTKRFRTINRQKFDADALLARLADHANLSARVHRGFKHLLAQRVAQPAFHPLSGQTIHTLHPAVFTVERTAPDASGRVLALHHVGGAPLALTVPAQGADGWRDLVSGQAFRAAGGQVALTLAPYQVVWLTPIAAG
jgi:sucrose phosphorylase